MDSSSPCTAVYEGKSDAQLLEKRDINKVQNKRGDSVPALGIY